MQFDIADELLRSAPMNLLLVEDNEADIKITLEALKKSKLANNVTVVKDGQEALDVLYGEGKFKDYPGGDKPHFILMDIRMPGMDGFMTLERLKSDPKLKRIPVAMLTTSNNQDDIAKSYDLGAVGYIQKPDTYEDFVNLIDFFNGYWKAVSKVPKFA